ncbi:MFS general substrate transporter [Stereum hirsutum FP-91666 SS1]|uniref:MFS general substrate transporter n=1 Tax=Stereum hirsutum (strain FP-91666) TaxID=721885 RepID=UPI000440F5FB|nr:MFS general substrate transporter [Stereum hirsutum FP-91666 SS1]EIM90581.1 MFS general substrate transporter [Stereum hirsutum FP-91666 SS1]
MSGATQLDRAPQSEARDDDFEQHTVDQPAPHPDNDDTRTLSGHEGGQKQKNSKEGAKGTEEDEWATNPANPRNWSPAKKWLMTCIVSLYTFVTPLASSMMSPALPDIAIHFNITNETILSLTLSIFLLAFAISPLFYAPMSEMYGRVWVLHLNNLAFLAFNIGCAFAKNTGSFIGFRFLAGWVGSAPLAVGGGVIQDADLFAPQHRSTAMGLYTMGPLVGPVVGPIAGGFITETIGYKYIFIVIVGVAAVAACVGIPFLRETYAPIIQQRILQKQSDEESHAVSSALIRSRRDQLGLLWTNLTRPFVMLSQSLICFVLSLYMALIYGIYYLMFTTFPDLFSDVYHFSAGISGLTYIGLGVGFLTATYGAARIGNNIYANLSAHNDGQGKPEFRVPVLIVGSFFVPIGLFVYGWSAAAHTHWIVPIIGTAIFGAGLMTTFLPIQLYLVDAFQYGASALSAAAVSRSLVGFAFPLFGQQMFDALGYGGGNSLLAGLAIVLGIPFPIWLWYYGEQMRMKSSLTR